MSSRRRRHRAPQRRFPATIELELGALARNGEATGEYEGQRVLAAFGLPGERVQLEVLEERAGELRGRVVAVQRPSGERQQAACSYFGLCGGCQLQHMTYERQLQFKQELVTQCLREDGGFSDPSVRPTLGAEHPWAYRNHGRFSVGRQYGELGFTTYLRHRFMRVDYCALMHPTINRVLAATQRQATGHQLAVRVGAQSGEILISPAQQNPELDLTSGQTMLEEELLGRRYRISAAAFFQVHTAQAERLITTAAELLDLRPSDVLLDLYCGVGTFGLALADRVARVIGVEESAAALKDAHYNARDLSTIEFLAGRTEEVLEGLTETVTVALVDPPRVGCRPNALSALLRLAPRRLAYVSCDPASLARDLRVLVDGGFRLEVVQPVDMFPQTAHIETVTLLTYEGQSSTDVH